MSDEQARSLGGLRLLVLDQDQARGDAIATMLRDAGAEAGTVPEGVEALVVIAEAVPDGIVVDRASPGVNPIKLRATLESDALLRSIVIVPGVLADTMKDGALALKRLVSVRLGARLALARNLENGNEAEGSVTDVGPGALVRLAARAPFPARVEVSVGPRTITVSTGDGLLLGASEATGDRITQRGVEALAALLGADGGKFRITKEAKGAVANLVGEPDEHLRSAAAISRRGTNRPPGPGKMPSTAPALPQRDRALGRTLNLGGAAPAVPAPPPDSPRAVVALSDNPRPLGRTLLGVPAQRADSEPPAPAARPLARPQPSAQPTMRGVAAPAGTPGAPAPSRPSPPRTRTLLGMAAPSPGRAGAGAPTAEPITSKVETPAEVLVRTKDDELDDLTTDRLGPRPSRDPLPAPPADLLGQTTPSGRPAGVRELQESDTLLADRVLLADSGGDLPTVIAPRPAEILEAADAAARVTLPDGGSTLPEPSVPLPEPSAPLPEPSAPLPEPRREAPVVALPSFPIHAIDEAAITVPRAPAQAEVEAPTIPRARVQPEASETGELLPVAGALDPDEAPAAAAPPADAPAVTPAPARPSTRPTGPDPMASTWATARPDVGPKVAPDEWTDGGHPAALASTTSGSRGREPARGGFPIVAVLAVVVVAAAVGVGALWALKVGPFSAPPPPADSRPTVPEPAPPEPSPPEPAPAPELAGDGGPGEDAAEPVTDGAAPAEAAPAEPAEQPTAPATSPPSTSPSSSGGGDDETGTSGLRDVQDALAHGNVAGAQQAMQRLGSRERSSPLGETLQSQLAERQGDLDGAISHARRAASMRPGRSSFRTRLGDLLLRAGAASAARAEYEAALRSNPRDQNARRALERLGGRVPGGGSDSTGGGSDSTGGGSDSTGGGSGSTGGGSDSTGGGTGSTGGGSDAPPSPRPEPPPPPTGGGSEAPAPPPTTP